MKTANQQGYTLVEVLVASCLLALVLAGASAMALSLMTQEEINSRIARVQNYQEQLARLYQLGLAPDEAKSLAPTEPAVVSTSETTNTYLVPDVNILMERWTITTVYRPTAATEAWSPGQWVNGDSNASRTRVIEAYRPSIR